MYALLTFGLYGASPSQEASLSVAVSHCSTQWYSVALEDLQVHADPLRLILRRMILHFGPLSLLSHLSVSAEQESDTSHCAACFADTELKLLAKAKSSRCTP